MPKEWTADCSGVGNGRAAARSSAWQERPGVGAGEGSEARPEGRVGTSLSGTFAKAKEAAGSSEGGGREARELRQQDLIGCRKLPPRHQGRELRGRGGSGRVRRQQPDPGPLPQAWSDGAWGGVLPPEFSDSGSLPRAVVPARCPPPDGVARPVLALASAPSLPPQQSSALRVHPPPSRHPSIQMLYATFHVFTV